MANNDLTRIWASKHFKKVVKKKAAEKETTMIDYLDELADTVGERKKRKNDLWEKLI